jgi:electron transfer flavoprotein beta subunit
MKGKTMLNITVCVKIVVDPEAPVSTFKIDAEGKRVLPSPGVPPVINPYDENALEAALRIKEKQPSVITVISAAKSIPKPVIKKCLAVGADNLIVIEDEALENTDSYTTASILVATIRKAGAFDLILTGRMASDTNAGQVGQGIAGMLGVPVITDARKIQINGDKLNIERVKADGYDSLESGLPCVVTVSNEMGELRQANVKGLMAAQKTPFITWNIADLGIEQPLVRRHKLQKMYTPVKKSDCEIVTGETPEESSVNLAARLRNAGLI